MNCSEVEKSAVGKMIRRLLPLCVVLYIINVIDRNNIGYAALDMNKSLGFDPKDFGLLNSIFFIGYFFFEVPSNMLMHRTGARLWIGRIMFTWGLITCGMYYAQNFTHIAVLRFLLGIMEAGFFPGMMYYFTFFFPPRHRGKIISIFFLAVPAAASIGAPLATQIMAHISWFGAEGWRWVFMIEGLFAILGAIAAWTYLKDDPRDCAWLTQEEKDWIKDELSGELAGKAETRHFKLGDVFKYPAIWRLGLIYMFIQIPAVTFNFWAPILIKEFSAGFSNTTVGWIMLSPGLIGAAFMLWWGPHSDRTGERIWHTAIPMLIFISALTTLLLSDNLALKIAALMLTGIGNYAHCGPYWSMPSIYLSGEALAIGLALINSLASFSGFSGNLIVGYIKASGLGASGVFSFQIVCAFIAFALAISMKPKKAEAEAPAPGA